MLFDPAKDTWTPDRQERRAPPQPIVPRDRCLGAEERRRIVEAKKAERRAAEEAAMARRAAFVLNMTAARERRRQIEAENAHLHLAYVDRIRLEIPQTMLGRLSLIVSDVAAQYSMSRDELRCSSRSPVYSEPRRLAAWRMWKEVRASFAQIGRALNRDHSTAIHLIAMHAGPHGLDMPLACWNRYARELRRKADAQADRCADAAGETACQ